MILLKAYAKTGECFKEEFFCPEDPYLYCQIQSGSFVD